MTTQNTFAQSCVLCHKDFIGYGNNPHPLADQEDRCCDTCNIERVIPARFGVRVPHQAIIDVGSIGGPIQRNEQPATTDN